MSQTPIQPGFMVIHSNKPELLQELLVRWYRLHPLPPLDAEMILVQSNGIAQWLKMALATLPDDNTPFNTGVAAAVDMVLPSSFIWRLYQAVLGADQVKSISPFSKEQLVWRLIKLLPLACQKPSFTRIHEFLRDDHELRKHIQLAEKMADLYDQYQVYRADWLNAWEHGEYVLKNWQGEEQILPEEQRWQAELWQMLLQDMGAPKQFSRAITHQRFIDALAQLNERPPQIPQRITVFGISSLPYQALEALRHVAKFSQVILCVHNPCEHHWTIFNQDKAHQKRWRQALKSSAFNQISEEDLYLHHHPLLNSWGKQGKDYLSLLETFDEPDHYQSYFLAHQERIDLYESYGQQHLLQQLQEDILQLNSIQESQERWPVVEKNDHSICFRLAHSEQREIEVLQDYLLDCLAKDPNLHPKDIIVMLPDVTLYAPYIQATFGQIDPADPRHIPFSIADFQIQKQIPLLNALKLLLNINHERMTTSHVLDLLQVPAIGNTFQIKGQDLELITQWIQDTNIRWGLDIEHRKQFSNYEFAQNTWWFGIEQMLLGYTLGGDEINTSSYQWQNIQSYSEVAGLSAELAGSLAHFIRCLKTWHQQAQELLPHSIWAEHLNTLLLDFFTPESAQEEMLLLSIQKVFSEWTETCREVGLDTPLPLTLVADHCLNHLDQPSLNQRFMAGGLTFATLMPMRAIPFKVVCLLGMNDGRFPRDKTPIDFDLMRLEHRPGDRSRREDDRYLFLEALLAAREKLYISWIGRHILDNRPKPASVLVKQLRDHISLCWRLSGAENDPHALLAHLSLEHYLQPFNPQYFNNQLDSPYFTYAKEWELNQEHNVLKTSNRHLKLPRLASASLPQELKLKDLASFLKSPAKVFLNQRLMVYLETDTQMTSDYEPFSIRGLDQWRAVNQLINSTVDETNDEAWEPLVEQKLIQFERQGFLPVAQQTERAKDELRLLIHRILNEVQEKKALLGGDAQQRPKEAFSYHFKQAGKELWVNDVLPRAYQRNIDDTTQYTVIKVSASNLIMGKRYHYQKLFSHWVEHIALNHHYPNCTSTIISPNGSVTFNPLSVQDTQELLTNLIKAYITNLHQLLPVMPEAAITWFFNQTNDEGYTKTQQAYENVDLTNDPYAQRIMPDFGSLIKNKSFLTHVEQLYAPLIRNLKSSSEED